MNNRPNDSLNHMRNLIDEPTTDQNQRIFGDPNYGYPANSGMNSMPFSTHIGNPDLRQQPNLLFQRQQQPQLNPVQQHQQPIGTNFISQPLPSIFSISPPPPPPPPHLPYPQQEQYQSQHQQFSNSMTFAMAANNPVRSTGQPSFGLSSTNTTPSFAQFIFTSSSSATTTTSSYSSSTNPSSSEQQSSHSNRHVPTTEVPFSTTGTPATFSGLSKESNVNRLNNSANLMSSTLDEYGPPPGPPTRPVIQIRDAVVTHISQSNALSAPKTNLSFAKPTSTVASTLAKRNPNNDGRANIGFIPTTLPRSTTSTAITTTTSSNSTKPNEQLSYSPPPKQVSPPLDQIHQTNLLSSNKSIVPTTSSGSSSSSAHKSSSETSAAKRGSNNNPITVGDGAPMGRIPKVVKASAANPNKYNEMSLLSLKERYREHEAKIKEISEERDRIEKQLNDMTRNSHGREIEMQQGFRSLKEQQRQCENSKNETRAKLKKIEEVLHSRFAYTIRPMPVKRMQQAVRKRAKMSTAAPTTPDPKLSTNPKDHLLKLNDSKNWCKSCDCFLDTFKEFCEHLHKRTHMNNMKRSEAPWRKAKETLSQRRTYDMLKSICSKVAYEYPDFSTNIYDKVLNPAVKDSKYLKSLSLNRERSLYEPDDPFLAIKGQEHLIPVMGFYCQLCDRTIPDIKAAEQHVKGWDHNYRHAINVATDEVSEQTFRQKLERSYKQQFPTRNDVIETARNEKEQSDNRDDDDLNREKDKDGYKQNDKHPVSDRLTESSTTKTSSEKAKTVRHAPVKQYKKATSHIVYEHELILDKFDRSKEPASKPSIEKPNTTRPQRDEPADIVIPVKVIETTTSGKERLATTKPSKTVSPKKNPRSNVDTNIYKLGERSVKPTALKRLRTETAPKTSKAYISSSSDTESLTDDVEIINDSIESDDPDNPFPHLKLNCTGNLHVGVLKDKRLAQSIKIVMKKENLEEWKDKLLDQAELKLRLAKLMTKKEPTEYTRKIKTKPIYYTADGKEMPITFDESESEKEEKPDIEGMIKDFMNRDETDSEKDTASPSKKSKDANKEVDKSKGDDGPANKNYSMGFLDDFFTEN